MNMPAVVTADLRYSSHRCTSEQINNTGDRHIRTDRQTDGWMDGQVNEWAGGQTNRQTDGLRQTGRWMDGQVNGWASGQTDRHSDR